MPVLGSARRISDLRTQYRHRHACSTSKSPLILMVPTYPPNPTLPNSPANYGFACKSSLAAPCGRRDRVLHVRRPCRMSFGVHLFIG